MEKLTGKDLDFNVLQNNGKTSGQEVMHVHFHLIPKRVGADGKAEGLHFTWHPMSPTKEELAEFCTKLAGCM